MLRLGLLISSKQKKITINIILIALQEKAKKKKCECDEEEEDEDDKKQTTKKPDEKPEDKPGENVCVTFGDPLCCIARWYREKKYYEYKKPKQDDPEMTKHFTQLVWNASNTLGCGMAKG